MSLDAIPAGARVLIDTNVLIYAKRALSEQCRRLLERSAKHEVNGALTTISVADRQSAKVRSAIVTPSWWPMWMRSWSSA